MQRRMGPKPDPTRRAEAIRGAWRRCTLVAGAGHAPRVRLARHRDSRRRGPGSLPPTLLDLPLLHSLSFHNALIVQAAITSGCQQVLSEDMQHGAAIGGVRIVNPFLD